MSFYNLFGTTYDINKQKEKLHSKSFSEDGVVTTWERMFDVEGILNRDVSRTLISDFLTTLSEISLFDIDFSFFDNINLDFHFELPSFEDVLRGKFISVVEEDFTESFKKYMNNVERISVPEEVIDRDATIKYFFPEEVQEVLKTDKIEIAKYGISRYDESVYGPSVTVNQSFQIARKRMGIHIWSKWQKPMPIPLSPVFFKNPANTGNSDPKGMFNENPEFFSDIVLKRHIIDTCIKKGVFMDAWILDYSEFSEIDEEGRAVIEVDGLGELHINNLMEIVIGEQPTDPEAVLVLDLGRLGGDETVNYVHERVARFIDWRINSIIDRFLSSTTPTIFSRTGEEKKDAHKHRSILRYGEARYMIRQIRSWVKRVLSNHDLSIWDINAYASLVIEYVFSAWEGHRATKKFKEEMEKEELKEYLLNKAELLGLNRDILNNLLEGADIWRQAIVKRNLAKARTS
mgnify:CR=1 FL=1